MTNDRLTFHGMSDAFPGTVDLALSELPPGLIAITGPNGAGKTTLLEFLGPAGTYRALLSYDDADPVSVATGRDSYIVLDFSLEDGAYRARLHCDGPKKQTDAVLERRLPDGRWRPLNDGKRSTFDAAIRTILPPLEHFRHSVFIAQGHGDALLRHTPGERTGFFLRLLGLQHYTDMAQTAASAATLAAAVKQRLEGDAAQLMRETAPTILADIDRLANALQAAGGEAEVRRRELQVELHALDARLAAVSEAVATSTAATRELQTLEMAIATRRRERTTVETHQAAASAVLAHDETRIRAKRDADVAAAERTIANNQQILAQAPAIRAAVAALTAARQALADARTALEARRVAAAATTTALQAVERTLAALVPVEQQLVRATTDAGLLTTVPCHGDGAYAGCQFLTNATDAQARIGELDLQLGAKGPLADRIAALRREADAHTTALAALQARVQAEEQQQAEHAPLAAYDQPLAAAEARIAELTAGQRRAVRDAETLLAEARHRHDVRIGELAAQATTLDQTITRLEADRMAARTTRDQTASAQAEAAAVQAELTAARAEWDTVTAALASATTSRQDLARRRQDLDAKRARLADVRARLTTVDDEWLEWRDLAKGLGRGGLPDLELDAAGPWISSTTNTLLHTCAGPRFSIELVTQVAKADGTGMKDECAVRVIDNAAGTDWRDISRFSGGQKTLLQEALTCAIALYVNERSPRPMRTLWRDETGSALDPAHALEYVAMLRKVREIGGFDKIFYITHNAEAAALADAQIRVADGCATIVHAPFREEAA
jgi:DNA repair protein SbcC/Rad50